MEAKILPDSPEDISRFIFRRPSHSAALAAHLKQGDTFALFDVLGDCVAPG